MTTQRGAINPLALTMGEPGGVGAEITVSAWHKLRGSGLCFFVLSSVDLFETAGVPIREINAPSETAKVFDDALPVLPLGQSVSMTLGEASPGNASAVIASIDKAVGYALSGEASAVVTNPIQKSSLIASGFKFPGHTEFLADLTNNTPMPNGRTRGPVMMLAGPALKTVPVTIHQSVASAAADLSAAMVEKVAKVTAEALQFDFGVANPRLAISGLNPHAGEDGALGKEDLAEIAPAVASLKKRGVDARGPLPADTMFHEEARATYDAALCMLHDQALIPAKTLAFHDAVNVTLGLPIIRTSPDHGTALDIAGKGLARADSLLAAIRLAATMAESRASAQ
ncbi:4-hydroxythreonine-4-phosphate dehydrogenase PdxA [Hyphococcus formosus]|uniref:4-hydroxythreonine-4-phosphate dehydrogenase PdxA n=1 Tax=Hyphococcus formosus TaxID=3143534 RepID=UPI00398AFA3F